MTPEKALKEYMHDVKNQQRVCLAADNMEDAENLQLILEDFKAAINLMNFFRSQHKELRIVTYKELKNAV